MKLFEFAFYGDFNRKIQLLAQQCSENREKSLNANINELINKDMPGG